MTEVPIIYDKDLGHERVNHDEYFDHCIRYRNFT